MIKRPRHYYEEIVKLPRAEWRHQLSLVPEDCRKHVAVYLNIKVMWLKHEAKLLKDKNK